MLYVAVLIPMIFICVFTAVICQKPFSDDFKKKQKKYPLYYLIMAISILVIQNYQTTDFRFVEINWWAEKCWALFFSIKSIFFVFLYGLSIFKVLTFRHICNEINNGKNIAEITDSDVPAWVSKFRAADEPDTRTFGQKVKVLIAPSALFTYMFFVFGILEPYFANLNEWHFDLWDLLPPMAAAVIISVGIMLLCAYKIKKARDLDLLAGVLTMISVAAYIQNSFINSQSFLTGFSYSVTVPELLVNDLFWAACILVPFLIVPRKEKILIKGSFFISIGLLFIQISPLPYMLIDGIPKIKDEYRIEYDLDGSSQFEISTEGNVMVFFMDAFYSGYFNDYLEENPEYYDILSDFICFNNIATETNTTATSMPCVLTATDSDYSLGFIESNARCWNSENASFFYESLQNNNYSVRLYTDSDQYCGCAENMIGKIDNVVMRTTVEYDVKRIPTYLSMVQLSLYRYLPDTLKNLFMVSDSMHINRYSYDRYHTDESDWRAITESAHQRGIEFYNCDYYKKMIKGFTPISDKKLCVFQHLMGMHVPYCSETSISATFPEAMDGCMEILMEYIRQLKELGVYDKSTIIFTADHGINELDKCSPVMLIKPAGRTSDRMVINSAPGVLQKDLLPTVLDCEEIDYSPLGNSFFDLDENMQRVRICRLLGRSNDLPPASKCTAVGNSTWNCIFEYSYTGRPEDLDPDTDQYTILPIKDYWW